MIQDIAEEYGLILSPIVAFIFTLLTIYIKSYVDSKQQIRRAKRQFKYLKQLIRESQPPTRYYLGKKGEYLNGNNHLNTQNMHLYAKRMETVADYLRVIEPEVIRHCGIKEVEHMHYIKIALKALTFGLSPFLIEGVTIEEIQDEKFRRQLDEKTYVKQIRFMKLCEAYEGLLKILKDPKAEIAYYEKEEEGSIRYQESVSV